MPSHNKRFSKEALLLRSAEAFEDLYQSSHLMIFRYIYALSGGPTQEAEDLTAEVYMRAWKARRRFRGDLQAARGWLMRIARNLVIDRYRRQKSRPLTGDIDAHVIPHPGATPEQQALHIEQAAALWAMLARIPAEQREMLVLRYMLGWQVKTIAAYLDMKENTVSVTIRRLLQRLRQEWPLKEDENA